MDITQEESYTRLSASMARLTEVWHCHQLIWGVRDRNDKSKTQNECFLKVSLSETRKKTPGMVMAWCSARDNTPNQITGSSPSWTRPPQSLSSPQSWAHPRALLTSIFKSLSTIRRGALGASEVTKFSGSQRNAAVLKCTLSSITLFLPWVSSSTPTPLPSFQPGLHFWMAGKSYKTLWWQ